MYFQDSRLRCTPVLIPIMKGQVIVLQDCNNNACVPSDTGSASAWKDDTYMQKWLQRTAKAFADQEKDSTEMASDNEGMDGTLLTALIPASGDLGLLREPGTGAGVVCKSLYL